MEEAVTKYYGIYRGKVLDDNDPSQQGRTRIEVYPMLVGKATALQQKKSGVDIEGIDTTDLPWAKPATPLFTGAGIGYGMFAVPKTGTFVWVFFEAGDPLQPVYFAEAIDGIHGLPSDRLTNYPQRKVIKLSSGATITIDDSDGSIIITGKSDVVVQGDDSVRLNPLPAWS